MQPESSGPFELIVARVSRHLEDPGLDRSSTAVRELLPEDQVENIDAVLKSNSVSYRDVLIVQLAYRLSSDRTLDLTQRHIGARTVGQRLGRFFASQHIRKVQDAYQNIGKNSPALVRGNFPQFDTFLRWVSVDQDSKIAGIEAAFDYACAVVAATSRPVLRMPPLDRSALTFANVNGLLHELFDRGSQGAYEQFAIAALLTGLIEQEAGTRGYRVMTKSLNASDKSSRTAGDVQIVSGNRVVEAFEVTANDWETKISGAEKTLRDHDLSRIHIVASIKEGVSEELFRKLQSQTVDVSVLELRQFAALLTSALTRNYRADALVRLYEYLDRYQPDMEKVNLYVRVIESRKLQEGVPR